MKKLLILFTLTQILLVGCQETLIKKIKEDDIKKYGISYEAERIARECKLTGISYKDGKFYFYVDEIKPGTRKKIEQKLIEIFGQKIDFILREERNKYD